MKQHHFYKGMLALPTDLDALENNARGALKNSALSIASVRTLEDLTLGLDAATDTLNVGTTKLSSPSGRLRVLHLKRLLQVPKSLIFAIKLIINTLHKTATVII